MGLVATIMLAGGQRRRIDCERWAMQEKCSELRLWQSEQASREEKLVRAVMQFVVNCKVMARLRSDLNGSL